MAVYETHNVKRSSGDFEVLTHPEHWRDRYSTVLECGDDAVLTTHVMRACQHMAHGWAPQDVGSAVSALEAIGEVAVATSDDIPAERTLDPGNVVF
jgi:hypothetical protein